MIHHLNHAILTLIQRILPNPKDLLRLLVIASASFERGKMLVDRTKRPVRFAYEPRFVFCFGAGLTCNYTLFSSMPAQAPTKVYFQWE